MKKNTFTNETLIIDKIIKPPLAQHVVLLNNHFQRYNKAIDLIDISDKDIVIDASCGLGYGSYILSQKAKIVYGLDINKQYLNSARKIFKKENVVFALYKDFKKNKLKVDKITCIETYEHIPAAQTDEFLKELFSFLKPGGKMFLTTPLGNNQASSYNKFHLNEPTCETLFKYFVEYFGNVKFNIGQFEDSFGRRSKYCLVVLENFILKKI